MKSSGHVVEQTPKGMRSFSEFDCFFTLFFTLLCYNDVDVLHIR